ncbi:MAG: hypothetical protein EPO62_02050 [Candidatus Nitrosotenuis sp.]|nr:MAG: hypothetical protein EPO62_02050 [Candidatus Nitrosotenuis sp.]
MVASSVFVNDTVQVLPNPYALTIKPRLEYSVYLTQSIFDKLQKQWVLARKSNLKSYLQNDGAKEDHEFNKQVEYEGTLTSAITAIKMIQKRLESVSQISNITETVSPMISILRTVNSNIYLTSPQISQDFIELSGILGSIVMDSGSLIEAKFDFKQTNLESKQILDEVNLISESKIRKQYPNLNF